MKRKYFPLLLILILLAGCAGLQERWQKATPDEKARIIIADVQAVMSMTIKSGAVFVDANPKYRPQWQTKVLPTIQLVNNICKDFIAKQQTGTPFTYQDVTIAVASHMQEIRNIMAAWGVKVGWTWEGGDLCLLS